MNSRLKWGLAVAGLVVIVLVPVFVRSSYAMHILILSLMYTALALSYDIAAGHVGAVSLAHPVFFGLGAYIAAILGGDYGVAFWANMLVAAVAALTLALLIAIPAFRLKDLSFAIATLGLALSAQIVAHNWVSITEGPRCLRAVPRPSIGLGGGRALDLGSSGAYYYLFLGLLLFVGVSYTLITSWRLGRTFTAVRNDEVLAATIGINVVHYKRIAFLAGAALAGVIGSLWAQYITIVCPDNLGIAVTNNLLIFIFVGGAGSLWGVVVAAVVFTVIPEMLRIAPATRLILFGIILFVIVVALPNGIAGLPTTLRKRVARNRVNDEPTDGRARSQT